jgi:hypothetical protein
MTHDEFRTAFARGQIRVHIDAQRGYRYLSARLLLPLVMLAVIGIGTATVIAVHWFLGLLLVIAGFILPRLFKATAASFLLTQAVSDPQVYGDLVELKILYTTDAE